MKKWLSILALSTVFALAGCGGSADTSGQSGSSSQQSSTDSSVPDHVHVNNNGDGFCDGCGASILTTLNIFSINDLHGKFADTDQNCGVDEMTTFLRNQQQANPNTILLSAGDMWQGSPESNLTYGNIITEWMNDLGFVSMALGNHEYDWGEEYIQQNADLANFPILGINVFDPDTNEREEYAAPSVMIERSGVKIGIIGAIGDCMSSIAPDKTEDVYFKTGSELTQLIKDESTSLRQQGADIIIYTIHDSGDAYGSYYDEQLSNGYVDLVFEGHSHQEVRRKDSYGVWHLQAGGDNGTGLSHAEIKIDIISGNITVAQTKIVSHSAYLHLDDDPIVNALMEKYADQVSKMNEYLGMNDSYRNSDALASYAAEAMFNVGYEYWNNDSRYAGKIVLGGGFLNVRSPYKLDAGKVTYGNVYPLFPFDNLLVLCKVNGSRLLEQFIYSSNYVCYYGEEGEQIKNNLQLNETYYVVVDTYCANYNFKGMGWLEIVEYYQDNFYTRDALAQFIKDGGMSAKSAEKTSSIPEILEIGNALADNEETKEKYRTVGKIVALENTVYGNAIIEDKDGNQIYVYGMYDTDGKRYDAMSRQPQEGEVVTVEGKIKNFVNDYYGQKIEFINATVLDIQNDFPADDPLTPPEVDDKYTPISEIFAIANALPVNGETEELYTIKGVLTSNPTHPYGNTYVQDSDGFTLYIYGLYDVDGIRYDAMSKKPQIGDVVVLEGKIKNYYNKTGEQIIEMISATVLSIGDDVGDSSKPVGLSTLTLNSNFGGDLSEYDTGTYGSGSMGGVTFEYYRAYKTFGEQLVATLLPTPGELAVGATEGALYNTTPIYGIQSISITYKSEAAALLYTSDDRIADATAYVLPKSISFQTISFEVDTDNFFKIITGNSSLSLQEISFSYTNEKVSYNTQKQLSGIEDFRLNPTTFEGTLIAGQSSVSVPVKVEYDGGRYEIKQTKTYTYYTVEYVESHPEIKGQAAMLTPEDVAAYYAAFKQIPANYAAKTKNLNSVLRSYDNLYQIFGEDTRYVSKYNRSNGYAQYVPHESNNVYYEFDIAFSSSYWERGERGVGRVVTWEYGWIGSEYDASPVSVYTDDHYATFQEYLNTGEFGKRFDAEMNLTFIKHSEPDTVQI